MEGYIDGGIYREIEMEIQIDGESDVKWGEVYWMVEPEYKGWHSYASLSVWAQEQLGGGQKINIVQNVPKYILVSNFVIVYNQASKQPVKPNNPTDTAVRK